MAAPPISERHLPHFHRRAPMKEAVRAATTASITISTALNNGDSLDGLTLATGDRVLVKDNGDATNGIYVVGVTPVRDYDESTDDPAFGYLVFVREGTANGGTLWKNTNTSTPTIGSTTLTFAAFTASVSFATPSIALGSSAAAGAASTVIRSDSTIAAFDATSPSTQALGDSAVVGTAAFAARRDHKHAMPALSTATPIVASGSGAAGTGIPSSREDHVHPAGAGSGTVATVEEVDGSPTDSAVTKIVFPNGTLSITSHVATYTPTGGGGGPTDYVSGASGTGQIIIPGLAGSPDIRVAGTNDDEFDTTDTSDPMTGWTTLGTPTTHDMNSTAKSHYHVQQTATAGTSWVGIYKACPTIPFTVTAKLAGNSHRGNYNAAGLFVAEASPGKILALHRGFNSGTAVGFGHLGWELFTNRTTFSTTYVGLDLVGTGPMWLRIVVTSSTNIAAYWSFDGVNWTTVETGRNPGFTVGAAGLAVKSENATYGVDATYDWIRFT